MKAQEIRYLLNDHARTFALTLRILPRSLREPLVLGYLLARASDTIADAGTIPCERRIALLEELRRSLGGGRCDRWQPKILSGDLSDSEEELIRAVPQLIAALQGSPDSKELISLWQSIIEGQLADLTRFPSEMPLGEEELKRYCFLVAGAVGETWTLLIAKHEPQTLLRPEEEMKRLGGEYGKGLQLVNILRDRVEDRSVGRLYVKNEDLSSLYDLAEEWLGSGEEYLTGLRPGRILMATALPHDLAVRTLREIKRSPEAARVRIPRREVRDVLVRNLYSLCLPRHMNPAS
jgi:farnesyl-diphosphate farnesyltransferase